MPRRIDQVENIFLAVVRLVNRPDSLRLNRDAALPLKVHVVKNLVLHFPFREEAGLLDNAVCQRALAVINMRDDTEISDMTLIHVIPLLFVSFALQCKSDCSK